MILASFIGFLALFVAVGLASALRAKADRQDYYIASGQVAPWLAGLSAVATNNSGYMFIGLIGFTYAVGLDAIWLFFGWIVGDFLTSLFVHGRLKQATVRSGEASFASVLARWNGRDFPKWRLLAAVITVAFLGANAAGQIAAGGKALQGTLGWQPEWGAVVVALLVVAYSAVGGLRASIWTDAAQAIAMLGAMSLLFFTGVIGLGGISETLAQLNAIEDYMNLAPAELALPGALGFGLFLLGWLTSGIAVVGQPHIMVRFMALSDAQKMPQTRAWYYGYYVYFAALAVGVGLLSRLYLPALGDLDPELALPTMAGMLLPELLVGLILAGIFAATMSTADSLVLACSAAITHDMAPDRLEAPWKLKLTTALVTCMALTLSLTSASSVFVIVTLAWSTMACAFGPLLIMLALGRRFNEGGAVMVMLTGIAAALAWRWLGLNMMIFEALPGILAGFAVGYSVSRANKHEAVNPS